MASLALATSLLAHVRWFYHPGTGFSSLIWFGEQFAPMRIGALAETPVYTLAAAGYDGQFYAQIAVAGSPFDPALRTALGATAIRFTTDVPPWPEPGDVQRRLAFSVENLSVR